MPGADWLALIVTVLKFTLTLMDKLKATPAEKRRASLGDLDRALDKAKDTKDLRDLSMWLGRRL
jgi:hypothetical protein